MLRTIGVFMLTAGMLLAVKTPRPLPDVPISMPAGKTANLKDFHGKVVMLVLMSTTCSDCIAAVEMMNRIQKDFGARGLQAFAVAVGVDADKKNTQGFVDRYRPTFPVGYVAETPFRELADLSATARPYVPIFIFIDKKGVIRFEYTAIDAIMEKSKRLQNCGSIVEGLLRQP
jgi:thiol-disulfide isomerase/thioredoxin